MKYNYHTHSQFCDGKSNMEEMVIKAIELKYTHLGFSSHAPLPFYKTWAIPQNKLSNYFEEINRLQKKYSTKIKIFKGLEIDYLQDYPNRLNEFKSFSSLDYIIGAIHLLGYFPDGSPFSIAGKITELSKGITEIFNGNSAKLIEHYYETMMRLINQKPDILAHLDFIKNQNDKMKLFDNKSNKYITLVKKVLKCMKENNVILEINTRGYYKKRTPDFYPSEQFFPFIKKLGIPVIISSDAHHTSELNAGTQIALNLAKKYKLNLIDFDPK